MNGLVYYLKSKRMKRFILLVMMVMSVGIMQAQWIIQPEVGMTAVKRVDGYEKWQSGWRAGLGVEYRTEGLFGIKSGLYYTQRGYKLPPYMEIRYGAGNLINMDGEPIFGSDDLIGVSNGETKRHFLQIPLMAKMNLPLTEDIKLTVAAGPYVAFCLSNSYSYSNYSFAYREGGYGGPNSSISYGYGYSNYGFGYGSTEIPKDGYNDYNPFGGVRGFDWGGSVEIGLEVKDWFFKASYDISLGKEYKDNDIKSNYHTFGLSVGYNFKL